MIMIMNTKSTTMHFLFVARNIRQRRHQKRKRLSSSRLRSTKHVLTTESRGNGCLLDRGHRGEATHVRENFIVDVDVGAFIARRQ